MAIHTNSRGASKSRVMTMTGLSVALRSMVAVMTSLLPWSLVGVVCFVDSRVVWLRLASALTASAQPDCRGFGPRNGDSPRAIRRPVEVAPLPGDADAIAPLAHARPILPPQAPSG